SSKNGLLNELQLAPGSKLIVYVGGLKKEKRLKELIWGMDQLKAINVKAYLLIIGTGPLRKALERYSWLNRVVDQGRVLGSREDVGRYVSRCDIFWQAGTCERHSSAILEAMAAGIPVVAADGAGNREIVVPGQTGFLVPPEERAGFARCSLPLLENPE